MSDFNILIGTCTDCSKSVHVKSRQYEKTVSCPRCNASVFVSLTPTSPRAASSPLPQPVPVRAPLISDRVVQDQGGQGVAPKLHPITASGTEESEGPSLRPILYSVIAIGVLLFLGSFVVSLFATRQDDGIAYWMGLGVKTVLAVFCSLLGAIVLRAGGSWGARIDIPFATAYVTVLVAAIIIGFVQAQAFTIANSQDFALTWLLGSPLPYIPPHFVLMSFLISSQLRIPATTGFKIVGVMYLVTLAIGLFMGFAAWFAFQLMG